VIVIMQENRSFDNYFGTYPGAEGIPMKDGVPTACVPDPVNNQCVKPYLNHQDSNIGGPHNADVVKTDFNGGKMDGFITAKYAGLALLCKYRPQDPQCAQHKAPDIMGYHDGTDIPNYWAYAKNFVLQDHMFEPVSSYSFAAHLFQVSGWAATCSKPADPTTCKGPISRIFCTRPA